MVFTVIEMMGVKKMAFVFRILLKTIVPLPFVLLARVISCPGISAAEKKGLEGVDCDIQY